jgi:serine/threonine protein kinase
MILPEKFTDVEPLEPGQNAKVFRGTNSLIGREVFLKIHSIPAGDPGSALREPHLLQQLNHQNLVRIFGADKIGSDHLLLEMELIDGGSFKELIDGAVASGEWPSIRDCVRLVEEVAAGLNHLHGNGYIHRDIKPANLVSRFAGNSRHGVVADLGLASRVNAAGRAFASRHARLYRPPEVWQNNGYSYRSDIYQLGIVLFQLLGGGVDYQLVNLPDAELRHRTVNRMLFDLNSVGPHVGESLRRVLRKCICVEDARFATIADLIAALSSIRVNHPNWRYTSQAGGFELERRSAGIIYKVDVTQVGSQNIVVRQKKISSGAFRRRGFPATIYHGDIGRSREFRQLINWH